MNWVVRNWIILAVLVASLTTLVSLLDVGGLGEASAVLSALGWSAIALLALADGILRVLGYPSLLGVGRGFGRILAVVQIFLAILILAGLLSPIL